MEWLPLVLAIINILGPYIKKWLDDLLKKTARHMNDMIKVGLERPPVEYDNPVDAEKRFWDLAISIAADEYRTASRKAGPLARDKFARRIKALEKLREIALTDARKGKFWSAAYNSGAGEVPAPLSASEVENVTGVLDQS